MLIENVIRAGDISGATGVGLVYISPETTLGDATGKLTDSGIGLVLVLDKDDDLRGVLSERDIIAAIAKHGDKALQMPAPSAMTEKVQTCSSRDNPKDVINAMSKGKFRHMPVIDNGVLTGLVSSTDILKYLSEHMTPDEQFRIWVKSSWI